MKTIIITMSPRKSFSASQYYSSILKFFMKKGEVSIVECKTYKQYLELEKKLDTIDNLVIASPVYVDTLPSTVLERLKQIESYAQSKSLKLNVYALINCGFYEGEQCKLAIQTIELWSEQCGFNFLGGLGIGAGVMLSFIHHL